MPELQKILRTAAEWSVSEYFLTYIKERDTGCEATNRARSLDLGLFTEFLETKSIRRLDEIRPTHISAFLQHLERKGEAPATRKRRFLSIKMALKYATSWGIIKINSCDLVKRPDVPRHPPKWLKEDEKAQIEALGIPSDFTALKYACMIRVMLDTGMRVGEVRTVRYSQLDVLTLSLIDVHCKGGHIETFGLPESASEIVFTYIQKRQQLLLDKFPQYQYLSDEQRGKFPLFISTYRATLDDPNSFEMSERTTHRWMTSNLPGINPHRLRHSFVKDFYDATKDPFMAQKAARHNQVSTTMRYAEAEYEQIRAVVNKIRK